MSDPLAANRQIERGSNRAALGIAECFMEAVGLACFMIMACLFAVLIFHPESPVAIGIHRGDVRRSMMGLSMGATAIVLIYSPWGKRSGAHLNPAVTLAFLSLGKITVRDACGYIAAQFAGGLAGIIIAIWILGRFVAAPEINFVATKPGPSGLATAWAAEFTISAVLIFVVLSCSNRPRLAKWTGVAAGGLVALNIFLVDPISGMSMNPARTFASAVAAETWTSLWVYFTASPLGMMVAAQTYTCLHGKSSVFCAKLIHAPGVKCLLCARRAAMDASPRGTQ